MARIVNLSAPDSMQIQKMGASEVEAYVSKLADQGLELLGDAQAVGVNAVSMGQLMPGGAGGGGWAQWTRACCDRRSRIQDFEDPVFEQIGVEGVVAKVHGEHIESQMRIVELEGPQHKR